MSSSMLRVSILQLLVDKNGSNLKNLTKGVHKIREAAASGSKFIILPEFFSNPHNHKKYAEDIPDGETCSALSFEAKKLGVYIIGGTILEKDKHSKKIFNTTPVFGPCGKLLTSYRKIHKSIVDLPHVKIANDFDLGSKISTFSFGQWKVGLLICYDQYFPELSRIYAELGCNLIVMITLWPKHHGFGEVFKPLLITRALENQLYVIGACQARNPQDPIQRLSRSIVTGPHGNVVCEAGAAEEIMTTDLNMNDVLAERKKLKLAISRRHDMYRIGYNSDIIEHGGQP